MNQKTPEELLLDWSRAGFVDLSRDELKQAAEMLGVQYAMQTNNDTLRKKLCEAIGTVDATLPVSEITAIRNKVSSKKLSLAATPPVLGPSGRWGGRYRRVRLVRMELYKDFNAFPISWEGVTKYFSFDTNVDMAWPYFCALANMRETVIHQDLSADGKRSERRETTNQVLAYSDLGDTPGTENLPTDMRDYVQRLAKDNHNFEGTSRRDLMRALRWLHGPSINTTAKDLSDDDIRDSILSFIGVDTYAEAA
jgi:hypothetical protein